jgi:RNA polymerase sigma-B factor
MRSADYVDLADDELVLFRALRSCDDAAERDRIQEEIVRRHNGLVRWLAAKYNNPAVEFADLVQVGYLGLVQAIKRFDPERGSDFISFARPTVQGEIRRYFRDKRRWIRLPRKLQDTKLALRQATEELTHSLGRGPTVPELAAHLGVDEELVLEVMTVDDAYTPHSLDATLGDGEPDPGTLADTLGTLDGRMDVVIDRLSVRPLLEALPERDQRILHMRFFEDLTQGQIAEAVGLSQMHVSRLLTRILGELRAGVMSDVASV